MQVSYIAANEYLLARCEYEYPRAKRSDIAPNVLYDIIGRQRLEAKIIDAIGALVKRCPPELYGDLNLPIVRRTRGSGRPLYVVLRTTESGWFVTADAFYTKYDPRWLAQLDIAELRTCLRFLTQGRDLALGWSIDASLRRATELKQQRANHLLGRSGLLGVVVRRDQSSSP